MRNGPVAGLATLWPEALGSPVLVQVETPKRTVRDEQFGSHSHPYRSSRAARRATLEELVQSVLWSCRTNPSSARLTKILVTKMRHHRATKLVAFGALGNVVGGTGRCRTSKPCRFEP